MKNINSLILDATTKAIEELYSTQIDASMIQLQKTRKEFEGDITVVIFPFLKFSKKNPEETAKELGAYLKTHVTEVDAFNCIKGFLNLSISNMCWSEIFSEIYQQEQFGYSQQKTPKHVMVEYSSPNTNKPLHLGHIRNILLGSSVANILEANGYKVTRTQIINDRGIHICKSMYAWLKKGNNQSPQSTKNKGDKFVGDYYVAFDKMYKEEIKELVEQGYTLEDAEKKAPSMLETQKMLIKWEEGNQEIIDLWRKMNQWVYDGFDITYKNLNIQFDELYYESDTYLYGKKIVQDGLKKGIFIKKDDGSVWCDLSKEGLDEKLLLRCDGTSVYMTQDIGTAILRFEKHPDLYQQIYTVGNEQDYHFKVLFLILQKLGYSWAKENYHLSYGMIELPHGKMKSREGTVVDADDIVFEMQETARKTTEELGKLENFSEKEKNALFNTIGLGALKYFILKIDPKKKMVFNPEESIDFNGNTGPFIQYTYARIQSLKQKATELGVFGKNSITSIDLENSEKELIKTLYEYPEIIKEAGKNYTPALLANYIYELVKSYNHFYQTVPILKSEDKLKVVFRVQLSDNIGRVIQSGMKLLGIYVPDRM